MSYSTDRCSVHPEYNPFDRKMRGDFNPMCDTCSRLFHATEYAGKFPGEFEENGEGYNNALYRIGPLSLEQFGTVRFSLGFNYHFDDNASVYRTDIVNRTIYIDGELCSSEVSRCKELGCHIYRRAWANPPKMSLHHFLYAIGEGFREFWSTLRNPPKGPFLESNISA